jgi:MarR family transcriptional regulator, organic hydroperoxide resistance regulator
MEMLGIRAASTSAKGERSTRAERRLPLSISRPALLIDGADREFRRLIYRMIITESRLVDIRKAIAQRVGVTGTQYTMLMAILHLQGDQGISVGDLADYLEVTGPHITGEIRKLVAKGFVRKTANPQDRRGVLLQLSTEGRGRLLSAFDFIRNVNDVLFDGVSGEEFKALTKFNQKFMRNTSLALDWIERMSLQEKHAAR